MKWRGYLDELSDDKDLSNYLQARVTIAPNGWGNYGSTHELWSDVPMNTLHSYNSHILLDPDADTLAFEPGHKACYLLEVQLTSGAKNAQQNAIYKADLILNATQDLNPGWSQ